MHFRRRGESQGQEFIVYAGLQGSKGHHLSGTVKVDGHRLYGTAKLEDHQVHSTQERVTMCAEIFVTAVSVQPQCCICHYVRRCGGVGASAGGTTPSQQRRSRSNRRTRNRADARARGRNPPSSVEQSFPLLRTRPSPYECRRRGGLARRLGSAGLAQAWRHPPPMSAAGRSSPRGPAAAPRRPAVVYCGVFWCGGMRMEMRMKQRWAVGWLVEGGVCYVQRRSRQEWDEGKNKKEMKRRRRVSKSQDVGRASRPPRAPQANATPQGL